MTGTTRGQQRGTIARSFAGTAHDLRFGLRQLRKSPGFTGVVLLTLALGIGVNTSMFSAVQALLNRPLPYPDPDGLVQLLHTSAGAPLEPHHSAANFLDYRESGAFASVAAMNDKPFNLAQPGEPAEEVAGMLVSPDLFPLLGIQPELGRVFTPEEGTAGRNNAAILDHGFWQRRFGGDPGIVGRTVRLDGEAVTVVGVMPEGFNDRLLSGEVSLWRPLAFGKDMPGQRGNQYLKCIARLKPGATASQAQAAADVLAQRLHLEHPDDTPESLRLQPLAKAALPAQARIIMIAIMALAGFVLLIACANLANLQFARTALRGREFAIRGALGAPRSRIMRQLVSESLLLALIGGLLGLVLAAWCNALLERQLAAGGAGALGLALNARAIAFALAAAAGAGLAFGLAPAWLASRADVNNALKQGTRGAAADRSQHRIQHSLIIAETALALMLLAGAGLTIAGLRGFAALNPGWQADGLTMGQLTLPEPKYAGGDAMRAFARDLEERLAAAPGVRSAALCWNLPIRQFNVSSTFYIDGRPEPPAGVRQVRSVNGVTTDYFKTLGMPVRTGRAFTEADTADAPPVVVINKSMADAYWPDSSPLGDRIDGAEIVGVVGDVSFPANPSESKSPYQTYRAYAQAPLGFMSIAVRGEMQAAALRRIVADVDPDQPVGKSGPVGAVIGTSLESWAIGGNVLCVFALLGLSLAGLGLYGVISGFVARRTSEIGVRMALGARVGDVVWLVVGQGMRLALWGTAIGMLGAIGLARLQAAVLPELPAAGPATFLIVAAFLLAVALAAAWLPARRAARVDPMTALRGE